MRCRSAWARGSTSLRSVADSRRLVCITVSASFCKRVTMPRTVSKLPSCCGVNSGIRQTHLLDHLLESLLSLAGRHRSAAQIHRN